MEDEARRMEGRINRMEDEGGSQEDERLNLEE